MKIKLAEIDLLETVFQITRNTIQKIYPSYYPPNLVTFFLEYHTREKIAADLFKQKIYVIQEQGNIVGTITINDNQIERLFVLPDYQNRGFGSLLMDFGEKLVFKQSTYIYLDSSLPGKNLYLSRGYLVIKTTSIRTASGSILDYDEMVKVKASN